MFLATAETQLNRAKVEWNNYLETTGDGTAATHWFLNGTRNASTATVIAGGIVLATGGGALLAGCLMGAVALGVGAISLGAELPLPEKLKGLAKDPKGELNFCPNPPQPVLPETKTGEAVCDSTPKARDDEAAYWNGKICEDLKKKEEQDLERKILAAIREPAALTKKEAPQKAKPKQDSIALAKQALLDWKNGKDSLHDLGDFLIGVESDPSETLSAQWHQEIEKLKALPDLATRMDSLYPDYLFLYRRGHPAMTGLMEGRGGNCVAQTKLIVAAWKGGDLPVELSQKLAVQPFRKHLQAVLYNKEKSEVFNLLTGETKQEIEAPLYDPHILYHAFLTGKGETPP
ncbi:MAG: hypothetical protein Q7S00_07355, partial [bacterium]|nr:hypothetical protein [bacterium]